MIDIHLDGVFSNQVFPQEICDVVRIVQKMSNLL